MRALLCLCALGVAAPLQCPSRAQPELAREESPADALWQLSERFAAQGNTAARDETLRYLIDRFPTSRQAERARLALAPR